MEAIDPKYKVEHNGQVMWLSPNFVELQKVSDETVENIRQLHIVRMKLFDTMRLAGVAKDKATLIKSVAILEDIEFELQQEWGFDRDRNCHSWWYKAPYCTCPPMDNCDSYGTPYRVISEDCILHSVDKHDPDVVNLDPGTAE